MISEFLIIASICGISLGLTACCIILFTNKTHTHANRLLAVTLFCLVATMTVTFLLEWNTDYYAYVYRFPSPLFYLFLPSAFLYVRAVLKDERRFKKWDWLHFLPAILHLAEMLPFYFTDYSYRKELVEQLTFDPDKLIELSEGILPSYYHTALRFIQGSIYVYFMFRMLLKTRNDQSSSSGHGRQTYNWLAGFTFLISILAIPVVFLFVFPNTFFIQGTRFLLLVISFSFLVINLCLFFRPQILYGLTSATYPLVASAPGQARIKTSGDKIQPFLNRGIEIVPEASVNLEHFKPILEKYIADQQPFLKPGYSVSDLSSETGIPLHHLSALLNRVYEMRFTDFMNRMRINYIKDNSHNEDWDQLTLEGIAKLAGFNSRTTFFNAIKKNTGLTPSEFMASVKKQRHVMERGLL